jgi:hypothetical protein
VLSDKKRARKGGSLVSRAFDKLDDDTTDAERMAADFLTTRGFIHVQAVKTFVTGSITGLVGFILLPLDLYYLIKSMAYTCWGVGAIMDCQLDGKLDFALILALWTGEMEPHEVRHKYSEQATDYRSNSGATKKVTTKGTIKISAKLATKIFLKLLGKSTAGAVPVGGVVSGGVNVWIIESLGKDAETYYTEKQKLFQID